GDGRPAQAGAVRLRGGALAQGPAGEEPAGPHPPAGDALGVLLRPALPARLPAGDAAGQRPGRAAVSTGLGVIGALSTQGFTEEGMSRTTLCALTAAAVAVLSLTLMVVRHQVLGQDIRQPAGPGTFKVTLLLRGKSLGNARVQMLCPLEFKQQH